MNLDVKAATTDELVVAYVQAAAEHGRFSEVGNYRMANPRAEDIAEIYRELRVRGSDAQMALLPLIRHRDHHVRSWAGAHALEFSATDGEQALSELAESPGIVGLNASMTLREWRHGNLRFP